MSSELIFLGEELENEYNDSEISNIITELNQIFILFELYLIICLLFFSLQKSSFE